MARGLGRLRIRRETGGQRRGKDEEGQTGRQRKRNRDALTEAIGFLTARRLLCAEGRAADRLKALTEADDGRGERHDRAGAKPHARQNGRAEPGGHAGKQRGGYARCALTQQRRQAGAHDLRKDGARQADAAKRRADQLAVAQGVGEQNGQRRGLARQHGHARAERAQPHAAAEKQQQRRAQRRADERGGHVRQGFPLRAQQAAQHQRAAQRRPADEDGARVRQTGGDGAFRRAEQAQNRRGEKKPGRQKQGGKPQRGEERRGGGAAGGFAPPLTDAAADKAARAHAEREADGLLQQDQREARADGGGERRIPRGEDERLEKRADGGGEHGRDAGRGDFQRQHPHVAGQQIGFRHKARPPFKRTFRKAFGKSFRRNKAYRQNII